MSQQQAFLEAFDRYADALYRHAYFRVSEKEKAQDLVSETFTRTWDYLVKGNTIDEFRPFLYRTLNHLIVDEYRKKRTESLDRMLEEQAVPEGAFPELVESGRADIEFTLDAQRVVGMLETMPSQYREVVVLRYIDGLMPAEIAAILSEPVNTVSVRIHRGIAWLAKRVDKPEL